MGAAREKGRVVVHVDSRVLEDSAQPGISMLEEGQNVSAETSQRRALAWAVEGYRRIGAEGT